MFSFEWDDANRRHIALHRVTVEEAEEAFNSDTMEIAFDVIDSEQRLEEVGATAKGRILRIVTTIRGDKVRVVTAFDAPKQMKIAYFIEKGVRDE
jgi:uncharacterized DUF497 family protein